MIQQSAWWTQYALVLNNNNKNHVSEYLDHGDMRTSYNSGVETHEFDSSLWMSAPVSHLLRYTVKNALAVNICISTVKRIMGNSCPPHCKTGALRYEFVYLDIRIQFPTHWCICSCNNNCINSLVHLLVNPRPTHHLIFYHIPPTWANDLL